MSDHFTDASKTASFENTPETKRCSKDTIYRQAAIEEAETRLKAAYVWYDNSVLKDDYALSVKAEGAISALIECVLMLKGLPAAEPEPSELARDVATIIENEMDMRVVLKNAEPEIIHCKDCEYYHPSFCEIWSKYGTVQTREAGYCYMAERRTDEADWCERIKRMG